MIIAAPPDGLPDAEPSWWFHGLDNFGSERFLNRARDSKKKHLAPPRRLNVLPNAHPQLVGTLPFDTTSLRLSKHCVSDTSCPHPMVVCTKEKNQGEGGSLGEIEIEMHYAFLILGLPCMER